MIIRDELVEPYEIHFDGIQYTVGKLQHDKKGKEYLSDTSYYTKIEHALFKLISLKMGNKEEVVDLKTFYFKFKELFQEVKDKLKP